MIVACLTVSVVFISCDEDNSSGGVGGKQSPIGSVGNTFTVTSNTPGITGISAEIVGLSNGVSSAAFSVNITNPAYMNIVSALDDANVTGTTATRNRQYRITDAGIQSVYPEGDVTLVKYNAKVGDVYTNPNSSIRREVTKVSKENDYTWKGMDIKTIHIKETGRGIPGLDYIEFLYNKELGLVGCKIFLEDGTVMNYPIVSQATNVVSDNKPIGGSQSPMGKEGVSLSIIGNVSGVSNPTASVTEVKNGVSTVVGSANITNPAYLNLITTLRNFGILPVEISGTKVSGSMKYRITDKGIQSVYPDGNNFTAVEYDAKVGTAYTVQRNGQTVRREVTKVSTADDYSWNNMLIKTITVKETGRGIPGLNYMEEVYNHRFGLVGIKVFLDDGTTINIPFRGSVTN